MLKQPYGWRGGSPKIRGQLYKATPCIDPELLNGPRLRDQVEM